MAKIHSNHDTKQSTTKANETYKPIRYNEKLHIIAGAILAFEDDKARLIKKVEGEETCVNRLCCFM